MKRNVYNKYDSRFHATGIWTLPYSITTTPTACGTVVTPILFPYYTRNDYFMHTTTGGRRRVGRYDALLLLLI